MAYDFSGKTALVTGASRGIGREVTKQLAKAGAKVYALAKTQRNLDSLKAEVPGVQTICVDISNWNETKKLIEGLEDIDLLVNNAGVINHVPFGEVTEELFDSLYSVNLKPVINISQIVVERLKRSRKTGSIVNLSSVVSLKYFPNIFVHATCKAALDKLTKLMAVDLAPFKIRVNAVNPTVVDTDMITPFKTQKEVMDSYVNSIPLREICKVEDIANSVLFLLSDKARMITGTIFPVDGGQSAT